MNRLGLTNAMGSIRSLILDGRIPPSAIVHDVVGLSQRQTNTCNEWRQDDGSETWCGTKSTENLTSNSSTCRTTSRDPGLTVDDIDLRTEGLRNHPRQQSL